MWARAGSPRWHTMSLRGRPLTPFLTPYPLPANPALRSGQVVGEGMCTVVLEEPMKTLILVDIQNEFCPGGALAVPDGDAVVPAANRLQKKFDLVVATPTREIFASEALAKHA